jgi:hypothetical protein
LTPGCQSTQSIHSTVQFVFEHPSVSTKWFKNPYLVVLSVENENSLKKLIEELKKNDVRYSVFRESDIDNQVTSVCMEYTETTRRLTSQFPLMLKEYNVFDLIDKNNIKKGEMSYEE